MRGRSPPWKNDFESKQMKYKLMHLRPSHRLRRFKRCENGSFTIEFVIWMPIFAILLAIVMNLSMVFYYEAHMLRVAQDATRAFSLGKFDGDPNFPPDVLAEQYIQNQLSYIGATLDIDTTVINVSSIPVAQTVVSTDASQLMPFSLMSAPFVNLPVGVSTQFIIEF
jgi:Flp pilus assembly protein TadG